MPETIRLIAFDLDETVLDKEKRLPEENRAALLRAADAGIELVPATGRMYPVIPAFIRSLPGVRYAITTNGSDVYDSVEKKFVCRAHIDAATALEVMRFLDTTGLDYDCNAENHAYMTDTMYYHLPDDLDDPNYLKLVRTVREPVPDVKRHLVSLGTDVQKMQVFSNRHPYIEEVGKELQARFPMLSVTSSQKDNLEINVKGADKGLALQSLAEHLSLSPAEVMAAGDGYNDLGMIRYAGIGIAVENAVQALKDAAVFVTGPSHEAGFAKAVLRFCFGE